MKEMILENDMQAGIHLMERSENLIFSERKSIFKTSNLLSQHIIDKGNVG